MKERNKLEVMETMRGETRTECASNEEMRHKLNLEKISETVYKKFLR